MLAGTGQLALTQSGGAGFASDLATVAAYNISDPTSFFKQLLFKSYVDQVRLQMQMLADGQQSHTLNPILMTLLRFGCKIQQPKGDSVGP